jgi:hypothetical protein
MANLGTIIHAEGLTQPDLSHRIQQADRKWHALKGAFTTKAKPRRLRVQEFYTYIASSLLWGSESWLLTAEDARRIGKWENKKMLSILQYPKNNGEESHEYYQRAVRTSRSARLRWAIPSTLERVLSKQHEWAGQIHAHNFCFQDVIRWRDDNWWSDTQFFGQQRDPKNLLCWRHARQGRHPEWGRNLQRSHGPTWQILASQPNEWAAK